MNAHFVEEMEETGTSGRVCPESAVAVLDILDPAAGRPGQACHPVLIRRWRSGRVIWEGVPEKFRLMNRRYPRPVERIRLNGGDGE
jgi:hypothetical protein